MPEPKKRGRPRISPLEEAPKVSNQTKIEAKQAFFEQEFKSLEVAEYDVDEVNSATREFASISDTGELPFRVERFCNEYVIHYNEEKAAQESGWPIWNAAQFGRRLLSHPRVKREIEERQKKITKKLQITQERVLTEIASIAYSNLQDYYNADGRLKPIQDLTREQAAAISELVYSRSGEVKGYKLISKNYGLDALSKNLGLFDKDSERTLPVDFKAFLKMLPEPMQEQIKVGLAKRIGQGK